MGIPARGFEVVSGGSSAEDDVRGWATVYRSAGRVQGRLRPARRKYGASSTPGPGGLHREAENRIRKSDLLLDAGPNREKTFQGVPGPRHGGLASHGLVGSRRHVKGRPNADGPRDPSTRPGRAGTAGPLDAGDDPSSSERPRDLAPFRGARALCGRDPTAARWLTGGLREPADRSCCSFVPRAPNESFRRVLYGPERFGRGHPEGSRLFGGRTLVFSMRGTWSARTRSTHDLMERVTRWLGVPLARWRE